MKATDTIRIRIEPTLKQKLQSRCDDRGITLSHLIRDFLTTEANRPVTAAERFDAIMASAASKTGTTGLNEPTIDDINDYIDSIREQRLEAINLSRSA
ncbi:MAG: hypothetical protein FWD27_01275 [Coriobacteriia bacterium]|nr:hypothetical protein [Coriobacteriia bacterium]